MTLALPQEKVLDIQNKCIQLIASPKATIMELTKSPRKTLVHCSGSASRENSVQVLATATNSGSYQTKIKLSQQSLAELKWWKENLLLQNGKPPKIRMPQLIIQMDASKAGWGAVCQGTATRGTWSYQERTKHINVLELTAVKLAILTFTKGKSVTAIHLQIDNITAKNCYK